MPTGALSRRAFLAGAGAASAIASSSPAAAQEGTPTATQAGTATAAQGGTTHTVDMTDELVFDPDEITIAPGDTVVWENVGQIGHTVTAYEDEIPEEAEFFASGDAEDESSARAAYPPGGNVAGGESYQHTFPVEGEYGYFCIPHEGVGMIATLTVEPGGGEAPSGPALPSVPEAARTVGVAAGVGFMAILALTYAFLKYGGGGQAE